MNEINTLIPTVGSEVLIGGMQNVVMPILFAACLTLGIIFTIDIVRFSTKDEWEWQKKSVPTKIKTICRGIIGLTTVSYVIWVLFNQDTLQGNIGDNLFVTIFVPALAYVFPITILAGVTIIYLIIHGLVSHFIYNPIKEICSWFYKK